MMPNAVPLGITDTSESTLLDSGAAVHANGTSKYSVKGTRSRNTVAVSTARGVYVPPWKCKQVIPIRSDDGKLFGLPLNDSIILDDCEHTIVSPGKLGKDMKASFMMAPPGGYSYLTLAHE
jgi:hypothetical protein